jgi:hypothetical protein
VATRKKPTLLAQGKPRTASVVASWVTSRATLPRWGSSRPWKQPRSTNSEKPVPMFASARSVTSPRAHLSDPAVGRRRAWSPTSLITSPNTNKR